MTAFKELLIGGYVLRFWPSDNGWICGITESMMDALAQQTNPLQRTWVGLTNDELTDLFYNKNLGQESAVGQAIELLKERNS